MPLSRSFALLLLAGLIGLWPIAYASPPDQIWIPGFYDDADYDDVVVSVGEAGAVIDPPTVGLGLLLLVVRLVTSTSTSTPSRIHLATVRLRSPPSA